jgi:hypothetical protein
MGRRLEAARYSSQSHELFLEQKQGTGGDCEGIRPFKCAGDQEENYEKNARQD